MRIRSGCSTGWLLLLLGLQLAGRCSSWVHAFVCTLQAQLKAGLLCVVASACKYPGWWHQQSDTNTNRQQHLYVHKPSFCALTCAHLRDFFLQAGGCRAQVFHGPCVLGATPTNPRGNFAGPEAASGRMYWCHTRPPFPPRACQLLAMLGCTCLWNPTGSSGPLWPPFGHGR